MQIRASIYAEHDFDTTKHQVINALRRVKDIEIRFSTEDSVHVDVTITRFSDKPLDDVQDALSARFPYIEYSAW